MLVMCKHDENVIGILLKIIFGFWSGGGGGGWMVGWWNEELERDASLTKCSKIKLSKKRLILHKEKTCQKEN